MRLSKSLQLNFCLTFLLILSSNVFAINLTEYHQKINQVKKSVGHLFYPEEYSSEAQIIKEIRATLPENEKIEMKGATFEVSHKWLFDKLKEFESEPYHSSKKNVILNEILETFSILEVKLKELEQQETSTRTKDEDKQKLNEILKRQEFQKPKEKEESWLQKKGREFLEWIDQILRQNAPAKTPDIGTGVQPISFGLQIVVYALVIGLLAFLIYRFAPFFFKQIKNREKKDRKTRVILGETIAADEDSHNIFSAAEDLARQGDLRSAIRKGYIALLCELSDRKIIGLARHKTNRDYLRDVKKRKEIYAEVNSLTNSFERNWYGFNKADQQEWEEFRQTYKQTVSKT